MKKPIVGITAWRRELNTSLGPEVLQTLSAFYSNAVIEAGMIAIMFPNGQDPERADELIDLVDGLVISGGDDVHPATYDQEVTAAHGFSREVDLFEIALVRAARRQNKPVLAICRGIQLLNVALGGTLEQEVTSSGSIHELINDETDPDDLNARRHVVEFEPNSLLAEVYGSEQLKTNTLHHQGIAVLADELIVEGRTEDGLVEAARCDSAWWAIGVQWHPERLDMDHKEPLFGAFREAIEESLAG